jgi:hypothetical protein
MLTTTTTCCFTQWLLYNFPNPTHLSKSIYTNTSAYSLGLCSCLLEQIELKSWSNVFCAGLAHLPNSTHCTAITIICNGCLLLLAPWAEKENVFCYPNVNSSSSLSILFRPLIPNAIVYCNSHYLKIASNTLPKPPTLRIVSSSSLLLTASEKRRARARLYNRSIHATKLIKLSARKLSTARRRRQKKGERGGVCVFKKNKGSTIQLLK